MTRAAQGQRSRTYRVGKARPGTVCRWTIQPPAIWESLRRTGHLYVDLAQYSDPAFLVRHREEYDWMREQMAQRLPGYQGHYPW